VYQSTRKGKPWYGLIHGIYPNKQQAIDAGSRLRKTLRRQKPWVRNLAPLQKELRNAESGSK
jgi:DamX protein